MARVPGPRSVPASTAPRGVFASTNIPEVQGQAAARGLAAVSQTLQQGAQVLDRAVLKSQAATNERQVKRIETDWLRRRRELMFSSEEDSLGYYNRRGQGVLDRTDETKDQLAKIGVELNSKLDNERQKRMFGLLVSRREEAELLQIDQWHAKNESVADKIASEARLTENINDAQSAIALLEGPADFFKLEVFVKVAAWETMQVAEANDIYDQDTIATLRQEAESEVHLAMIERMLSMEKPDLAEAYMIIQNEPANINNITGSVRVKIEKLMKANRDTSLAKHRATVRDLVAILDTGKGLGSRQLEEQEAVLEDLSKINTDAARALENDLTLATKVQVAVSEMMRGHTLPEIKANIVAFQAQETIDDPAQVHVMKKVQEAYDTIIMALNKNEGVPMAIQWGLAPDIPSFNPADLQSYEDRQVVAAVATKAWGVRVNPISKLEKQALTDAVKETIGGLDTSVAILKAASEGLGAEAAGHLSREWAKEKRGAIAMALLLAPDREEDARDIIQGANFLAENPAFFSPTKDDEEEAALEGLGNALVGGTQGMRASILQAAAAMYAMRQFSGPSGEFRNVKPEIKFDQGLYVDMINRVTGGLLSYNGRNVFAPFSGASQETFDKAAASISVLGLLPADAQFKSGDPFTGEHLGSQLVAPQEAAGSPSLLSFFFGAQGVTRGVPRRTGAQVAGDVAQLVSLDLNGNYFIAYPGENGVILDSNGDPVIINLRDVAMEISGFTGED